MNKIREGDVFSFRYKPEIEKKKFYPYHCFDGQLIAKKNSKGEIYLEDTYWTTGGRILTPEEAERLGVLTFKCNLRNVEKTHKEDLVYYDDKDIFDLSYQHRSYEEHAVRKGAERSKSKMLDVVNGRIEEAEHEIVRLKGKIKNLKDARKKIKSGNLNVYL